MAIRYCSRCVTPASHPLVSLQENGICSSCVQHEQQQQTDWRQRQNQLAEITTAAKGRGRDYDCLIPVSGGKDSFWQVIKCLEYGLKPLTVTWLPPAQTELGRHNLDKLINIGVDHISFSINPSVEKTFLRKSFLRHGATAIPKHMAIHSIALKTAIQKEIPLIIWGENPAIEYGDLALGQDGLEIDERWFKLFGGTKGTLAQEWADGELSVTDLAAYKIPALEELTRHNIKFLFMGYFAPWDPVETFRVAARHGFQASTQSDKCGYYPFADVDCDFIDIHHYLKWFKFGYTRIFDDLSIEIRNKRLNRQQALDVLEEKGPGIPTRQIRQFCDFIDLDQDQFEQVAERFRDRRLWRQHAGNWVINDFLLPHWQHWQNVSEKN